MRVTLVTKPTKSKFFDPLTNRVNRVIDRSAEWIESNVTSKLADSKLVNKTANHFKDSKFLFNHIYTISSVITSGLYAYRTLNNEQLDKDRRNTLAINQLLTLGTSIVGSYALDISIDKWWNKVINNYKKAQPKDIAPEILNRRVTGMGLLKKMFIIGMVYRYLVPVLVTPIANKLGDKYIEIKKQKTGN